MSDLNWTEAERHFNEVVQQYEEIGPAAFFALSTFRPLRARFQSGERTKELYDAMMDLS